MSTKFKYAVQVWQNVRLGKGKWEFRWVTYAEHSTEASASQGVMALKKRHNRVRYIAEEA